MGGCDVAQCLFRIALNYYVSLIIFNGAYACFLARQILKINKNNGRQIKKKQTMIHKRRPFKNQTENKETFTAPSRSPVEIYTLAGIYKARNCRHPSLPPPDIQEGR